MIGKKDTDGKTLNMSSRKEIEGGMDRNHQNLSM